MVKVTFEDIKVELLDSMGGDLGVVNAARVSFDNYHEELDETKDTKLINYLARENHWSPFGHAQVTVRITMPIFLARQWMKSVVGIATNEVSRRYVDKLPTFYKPPEWSLRPDKSIKQGAGEAADDQELYQASLDTVTELSLVTYLHMIKSGIAPEQARMILPQNTMTTVVQTMSIYAAARLVKLRLGKGAQKEVGEIARQLSLVIEPAAPISWNALLNSN